MTNVSLKLFEDAAAFANEPSEYIAVGSILWTTSSAIGTGSKPTIAN